MRRHLVLLALLTVSAGAASFEVIPMDARADDGYVIVTDKSRRAVRQLGTPDNIEVVQKDAGKTDGVPLRTALMLLIPKGWHAVSTTEVDLDAMVGWESHVSWLDALEEIGLEVEAQFVVDWEGRRVAARSFTDVRPIEWGRASR